MNKTLSAFRDLTLAEEYSIKQDYVSAWDKNKKDWNKKKRQRRAHKPSDDFNVKTAKVLSLQIHPSPCGWLTAGFCCFKPPSDDSRLLSLSGTHVFTWRWSCVFRGTGVRSPESDLKGLSWGLLFYSDGNLPLVSQPLAQQQAQRPSDPSKTGFRLAHLCQLGVGVGVEECWKLSSWQTDLQGLLAHFPKVTCWIWIKNDYYIVMLVKLASKEGFLCPSHFYIYRFLSTILNIHTRLEGKLAGKKRKEFFKGILF